LAADIVTAWNRTSALPHTPDQHQAVQAIKEGARGARGTPATRPASRTAVIPEPKTRPINGSPNLARPSRPRRESSRLRLATFHARGGAALISSRTDYGDRLRGPQPPLVGDVVRK